MSIFFYLRIIEHCLSHSIYMANSRFEQEIKELEQKYKEGAVAHQSKLDKEKKLSEELNKQVSW